jgi:hypothetical protein
VEDAPPHRPEKPFPKEQRSANHQEEPGEQEDGDRQGREGDDPPHRTGDLADLRPAELDVSTSQRDGRFAGGADLLAQAWGRLAGPKVWRTLRWWDLGWVVQGSGSGWAAPIGRM